MEKFIPYEKLSKKEQRKLNAAKRSTWDMNPVTRRPVNPKAYNRKKTHREFYEYSNDASSVILPGHQAQSQNTSFTTLRIVPQCGQFRFVSVKAEGVLL